MQGRSFVHSVTSTVAFILLAFSLSACSGNKTALPSTESQSSASYHVTQATALAQKTYPNGTPWAIPGSIDFDNYDVGGQGIGYNTGTSVNQGGQYRHDGVGIAASTDSAGGNGYYVGWNWPGDWYDYTVNVAATGAYKVLFRVASGATGASLAGTFHVQDENANNLTGTLQVPVTAGWDTWTSITGTIQLAAGAHVLRVIVDTGNGLYNLNSMTFSPSTAATPTPTSSAFPATYPGGKPWAIPGSIDFDNYNVGGQGVGYNTGTSVNQGGQYRHDGVGIAASTDPAGGNGYYVGWNWPGDWYNYTVNVATTGAYKALFRVASGATGVSLAGTFHVQDENGNNLTGTLQVPVTAGWDTWTSIAGTLQLAAGAHLLRVVVDTGNGLYNLNSMTFSPSGTVTPTPTPTATPTAPPTTAAADDWTTFAHDQKRTGFEAQTTGITKGNVGTLALRWQKALGEAVIASPLAANGLVYITTNQGNVYALDPATGNTVWKTKAANTTVRMTPALADGMLFVGNYGVPHFNQLPTGASLVALSATTGAILWQTSLPGEIRSEPIITGGIVYEGTAGGDSFNGCSNGRLFALDERTGTQVQPAWFVTPNSTTNNGAGIWSPISFDGTSLYFGSGNACDVANGASRLTPLENSVLSMTPSLLLRWSFKANQAIGADEDVGGGVMLLGNSAYAETKSGIAYSLNAQTGGLQWEVNLHPFVPGLGGVGTPTGDGTMVIFSSGSLTSTTTSPGCNQTAFDLAGNTKYTIHSTTEQRGYAAFISGIGFLPVDRTIRAFDSGSGTTLWSYATMDTFYASPAIVPSGLYAVDNSGNVYAFGLPGVKPADAIRRTLQRTPHAQIYNTNL